MTLAGLDLNATRARAVRGPVGDFPETVLLEPPEPAVPLCVLWDSRSPVVGSAGLLECRRQPHLVSRGLLPMLGLDDEPRPSAARGLQLVYRHLRRVCPCQGLVLTLPDYLSPPQVQLAVALADQVALPLLGSVSTSLACALSAYAEQAWFGTAAVLALDDHALTGAVVHEAGGQVHVLGQVAWPQLGLAAWKARLVNALADCCILQSRRDPRDSPAAEQGIYDQLEELLHDARQGRVADMVIQAGHWYQNLLVRPDDTSAFCAPLVRQVLTEVRRLWQASWPKGPPRILLLTAAAALLPGLTSALQDFIGAEQGRSPAGADAEESGGAAEEGPESVVVLSPEAAARGAHALAAEFQGGALARQHLAGVARLPLPQPPEAGPARLRFLGQEVLLRDGVLTLGRLPECDLVFDRPRFSQVSPRHCEILYDPEAYQLRDHSREGTWVNDRPVRGAVALQPGDVIRLGPGGPVLRFLGRGKPTLGGAPWQPRIKKPS